MQTLWDLQDIRNISCVCTLLSYHLFLSTKNVMSKRWMFLLDEIQLPDATIAIKDVKPIDVFSISEFILKQLMAILFYH